MVAAAHELQPTDSAGVAAGVHFLFCNTSASATQSGLARLRTYGHSACITLLAFARTGETDIVDHAWLMAAAVRRWGSRVAQAAQTL
eukprot:15432041-Alexandrium_andersonii.AAC.1